MASAFRQRLERKAPIVLDAAMGTELSRRGASTAPPLWSARALVEAPELVEAIHRENVAAGADVLTIASFRLHARNLRDSSCSLSRGELIARAVTLARRAASEVSSKVNGEAAHRATLQQERRAARRGDGATPPSKKILGAIAIAGSLAPLEDCYRPDRVPSEAEISSEHAEMAVALARAGVDLILIETMNTIREALAAAQGAAATGLPVVVSCVTDGEGRLLSGERIEDFARALLALPFPPDALGVNCVAARSLGADLARLAAAASSVPLAAYGNTYGDPVAPEDYAVLAASWARLGARLVGGCCGTTAAHTAALRDLVGYGK